MFTSYISQVPIINLSSNSGSSYIDATPFLSSLSSAFDETPIPITDDTLQIPTTITQYYYSTHYTTFNPLRFTLRNLFHETKRPNQPFQIPSQPHLHIPTSLKPSSSTNLYIFAKTRFSYNEEPQNRRDFHLNETIIIPTFSWFCFYIFTSPFSIQLGKSDDDES